MASNKIFEKIPQVIPNRSGFDLSHEVMGTAKVGNLIPVFTREMMGKDSLSVNLGQQIQFPPFATDFYGRIKCYFEAFFVPYRIIDGGYKEMYKRAVKADQYSDQQDYYGINPYWRGLSYSLTLANDDISDTDKRRLGAGSLLDYLGFKVNVESIASTGGDDIRLYNMNRLQAYHTIYNEYYRDSRITRSPYSLINAQQGNNSLNASQLLSTVWCSAARFNNGNQVFLTATTFEDAHHILDLRQRCYAKDYFTTATVKPQFGNEMNVVPDANGNISVSQIRAAVALQQYVEIYNRTSTHYDDIAFSLTGIRPSDAAVDIPVYLGRLVYDVYNKSVYQSSYAPEAVSDGIPAIIDASNPFSSVGSKFSNGQSLGSGHLCDFTATEGGIFMVLMSVAPMAVYGTGVNRQWFYRSLLDMPQPQLAGIGDQPIYNAEISDNGFDAEALENQIIYLDESNIFGYTQRFAEAKFMLDEVHGLLRDGESLDAFALKRSFTENRPAEMSTGFLQVSPFALDEVASISNSVSEFGYWYDLFFETKLVSNLPAYSLPTLENMKGNTVMIDNGGRRL